MCIRAVQGKLLSIAPQHISNNNASVEAIINKTYKLYHITEYLQFL